VGSAVRHRGPSRQSDPSRGSLSRAGVQLCFASRQAGSGRRQIAALLYRWLAPHVRPGTSGDRQADARGTCRVHTEPVSKGRADVRNEAARERPPIHHNPMMRPAILKVHDPDPRPQWQRLVRNGKHGPIQDRPVRHTPPDKACGISGAPANFRARFGRRRYQANQHNKKRGNTSYHVFVTALFATDIPPASGAA